MPARLAKHCRAVWYPRGRKLSSGGEDRASVSHSGCVSSDIAHLTWWMTNDSQGEVGWSMCLLDSASKGKSGRMIPLSEEVRCTHRVQKRGELLRWQVRHQHRTRAADLASGDREHVPAMVPAPRLRRLFESQRSTHFHHQCGAEDLDRGRVAPGRPGAGRTYQSPDHAAVHRGQSGSAGADRRARLVAVQKYNRTRSYPEPVIPIKYPEISVSTRYRQRPVTS